MRTHSPAEDPKAKMGPNSRNTRSSRRKPLLDCTNTPLSPSANSLSSSASTSTKHSSSILPSLPSPTIHKPVHALKPTTKTLPHRLSSSGSAVVPTSNGNASNPPPPLTPRPPHPSSSLLGGDTVSREVIEPCSVYTRRKGKTKAKEVFLPTSYSAEVKNRLARDKRHGGEVLYQSKSCTVPPKKKQRWAALDENVGKNSLPQDFIDQQRAYFAEVDAFELSVEEVTSTEQLD